MELLLWRWSTTAQITSALMIAVFFVVLGRSVRRVEMRPWMYAWLANLAALLVTCIFWFAQPSSQFAFIVLRGSSDLNDFKGINDAYGHQTGDECLRRFARALQASFRPGDHVIRYAGDEFVVVAPSADPSALLDHVERMRERLKFERADGPPIRFAAGHASLSPKGDAEEALREADEAMYREKGLSGGRLRSV